MENTNFEIKKVSIEELDTLMKLIDELAVFEKMQDQVVITKERLTESFFSEKSVAESYLAFEGDTPIGYSILFYNFSSFLGKKGLYLEDLYVKPEYRGKGYGKAFLKYLAGLAHKENCERFEWVVLDWNQPAIDFYNSIGAKPLNEWINYRLDSSAIENFVNS